MWCPHVFVLGFSIFILLLSFQCLSYVVLVFLRFFVLGWVGSGLGGFTLILFLEAGCAFGTLAFPGGAFAFFFLRMFHTCEEFVCWK